jgi:hypothetical protein
MLVTVGVVVLGGVGVVLYTPQPATRTMAELRDAGITDGQRLVIECPERLTKQTVRRINANQPGLLRPKQSYARVARTARCFNPDGGVCFRPSDGLVRVGNLEGKLVVPSLRHDLTGVDLDAGIDDSTGEGDTVDDSWQYRLDDCRVYTCPQYDAMVDAGQRTNPFANNFCGALNRLALVPSPCMIPNGWRADGGWCEEECGQVDCRATGPLGLPDGGPRWNGFNVMPREYAVGADCVPVECSVVAGDVPQEWL